MWSACYSLSDEENAIRYACGFVARRLIKRIERLRGTKATQFRECLSSMDNKGDDSSYYQYTLIVWIGGSYLMILFCYLSQWKLFNKYFPDIWRNPCSLDELVKIIMRDDSVRQHWDVVSNYVDEEYVVYDGRYVANHAWICNHFKVDGRMQRGHVQDCKKSRKV